MDNQATYLAHYGVKGRDKGRKREARAMQREAQKLDSRLKAATVANARAESDMIFANKAAFRYEESSKPSSAKKYAKYKEKEDSAHRLYKQTEKQITHNKQRLQQVLDKAVSNGYAYRVTKTDFGSPGLDAALHVRKRVRDADPKANKAPIMPIGRNNVSSGNAISIRDGNSMSEKKKKRWSKHTELNTYRPQTFNVY